MKSLDLAVGAPKTRSPLRRPLVAVVGRVVALPLPCSVLLQKNAEETQVPRNRAEGAGEDQPPASVAGTLGQQSSAAEIAVVRTTVSFDHKPMREKLAALLLTTTTLATIAQAYDDGSMSTLRSVRQIMPQTPRHWVGKSCWLAVAVEASLMMTR